MNLLYLKINPRKHLFILGFLSLFMTGFAHDSIPNETFEEQCEKADAYFLYSYTDVTYSKFLIEYERQVSIESKMVVNNRTGVDKFAFLKISNYIAQQINYIEIKALKADGTVIELDSSLIFDHFSEMEQSDQINYPIPGIEPGDTIEIYYQYNEYLKQYDLMDFVNLYRGVPSWNNEYTIKTNPEYIVKFKKYNGFPEPQIVVNDSLLYCLFKMEKVDGIAENQYTCLLCELPYLYYTIEKKSSKNRTWKEVYNQEFNFVTQPMNLDNENSSYYKKWKKRVIGDAIDSSKYYQFKLLHEDILLNSQIEGINKREFIKSSGFFLKEQRFDPISIKRLYRQLLEDLDIEYWAIFARSKRVGSIDPYYIRRGEYDHIFFAYDNGEGSINLLYPHDVSFKYLINEIPTSLYNTDAVMVKPYLTEKIKKTDKFIGIDLQLAEVDSVILNIIKLPGLSANVNYLKQTVYCDVNLMDKNVTFKSQFSLSGGLSTDVRSFYSQLNQDEEMSNLYTAVSEYENDEEVLEIDSVSKTKLKSEKPFTFYINAEGSVNNSFTFLSDSLVSITLNNIIKHTQIESYEDSTQLNFYLDYCYSDLFMYIIKFPSEIEILGFENYNKYIKNDYGEYLFNINLIGKDQLMFQSNYKIIKDMIPKDDYEQLKALNEFVKETKNMRLLVKLSTPTH